MIENFSELDSTRSMNVIRMGIHVARYGKVCTWPKSDFAFIQKIYKIAKIINDNHKATYLMENNLSMQIKIGLRIWDDLIWTSFVINFYNADVGCVIHIDRNDVPTCSAIFNLGHYTGGEFVNVTQKEMLDMERGSFTLIDSHNNFHGAKKVISGKRVTIVFFTHQNLLKQIDFPVTPLTQKHLI